MLARPAGASRSFPTTIRQINEDNRFKFQMKKKVRGWEPLTARVTQQGKHAAISTPPAAPVPDAQDLERNNAGRLGAGSRLSDTNMV